MPETANKRAVSFDDFAEASKKIATKTEVEAVKKQIEDLPQSGTVEFATTEEVLALFADPAEAGQES